MCTHMHCNELNSGKFGYVIFDEHNMYVHHDYCNSIVVLILLYHPVITCVCMGF